MSLVTRFPRLHVFTTSPDWLTVMFPGVLIGSLFHLKAGVHPILSEILRGLKKG